jgi:hypothetical protein
MKPVRLFIIIAIAFMALSWFSQSSAWKKTKALNTRLAETSYTLPDKRLEKLEQKAAAAKKFVQRKEYNEMLPDRHEPSIGPEPFLYL